MRYAGGLAIALSGPHSWRCALGLSEYLAVAGVVIGLAGAVYARSQRNDARRFREQEEQRRAKEAEDTKNAAADEASIASKRLRFGKDISAALTFLVKLEEETTKILDGTLLSRKRMNQINLNDYARRADALAGRLPDGTLFARKDRGIAHLIDVLADHPFDDSEGPMPNDVCGKLAITQYRAAVELQEAIKNARSSLRDELS